MAGKSGGQTNQVAGQNDPTLGSASAPWRICNLQDSVLARCQGQRELLTGDGEVCLIHLSLGEHNENCAASSENTGRIGFARFLLSRRRT